MRLTLCCLLLTSLLGLPAYAQKSGRSKVRRTSPKKAPAPAEPQRIEIYPDSTERLTAQQTVTMGLALHHFKKAGELYRLTYSTKSFGDAVSEGREYVERYRGISREDAPSRKSLENLETIYRSVEILFRAWSPAASASEQNAALNIVKSFKLEGMNSLQAANTILKVAERYGALVADYKQRMDAQGLAPEK